MDANLGPKLLALLIPLAGIAFPLVATGGAPELAPAQLLALVMALGAAAWLLSESAARGA